MNSAATFDYIETDFADASETLSAYRSRTSVAHKPALVRRITRRLNPLR
jgi:hypothetical protein